MEERFYELAGIRYRFLVPKHCLWDPPRLLNDYMAQPGSYEVECILSIVEEAKIAALGADWYKHIIIINLVCREWSIARNQFNGGSRERIIIYVHGVDNA